MRRPRLLLFLLLCAFVGAYFFTPATSSQSGQHSLSLNGSSQYVSVPNSTSIDISGPITIEAWIKLSSATGSYQDIVCREAYGQASTGGGYELGITNLGKIRLDLFQSPYAYTTVIGSSTLSASTWHHVAGVFDGSQMRVYLDGTLDGSVSSSSGPASGTSPLRIGNSTYANYYFGGLLDEVRVSAAALYSSNFTAGLGTANNTRGHWRFNGQTANDFSGNGNNGTLQGSPAYSSDVPAVTNAAPVVSLTDPLNNTAFNPGATVLMDATASDSDGSISKVEFYQGSTLLGTDYSAPYVFLWNSVHVGSYSLTAKAFDDTGASTNSAAITINVTSSTQRSLSLDGTNDYLTVSNSSSIDISGPITIEAWIKLNSATGSYQDIVCREAYGQAGTGGGYELGITNTGKIRLDLFQSPYAYTTVMGTSTVSANAWHHVAGVFDGSQMRIYLDGTLDGSVSSSSGPASGTSPLRIGNSTYANYYFGGLIDDVRISAAALYSSNFTAGLGTANNTRGHWKFDGGTADDYSGNGNHGALQNEAAFSTDVPVSGGAQQTPVPVPGGPYSVDFGQAVQFSSSGSSDPDGSIVSYRWNFGDGSSASTANPSHTYSSPGLYTASLTVTDNAGLLANATTQVTINGSTVSRLEPRNQTGGGGENPLSQNYNWTLPILNLPGRAGLDLQLSLSYNSLVWTKNGSYISFDDDGGFPSAGFRLGFPSIQPIHFNADTGKWSYLLIGSDGSRTELRQVAANSVYFESAESSHTLLDTSLLGDPTNPRMMLRAADGTQLTYKHFSYSNTNNYGPAFGFECTEIKDRNGNYITIQYNSSGKLERITDTLARQLNFIYNSSTGLLESIEQTWTGQSQPHKWAQFTYENNTVNTNFQNLTRIGPANGSTVPALKRVTLPDNSKVEFDYTYWAQIWKINSYSSDGLIANYRAYNLPGEYTTPRTDCPRFTERRDWAKNWNRGGSNGAAGLPAGLEQEVLVGSWIEPLQSQSWTLPDGTAQTGTVAKVTRADGTYDKIYFASVSNSISRLWARELPAMVETFGSNDPTQGTTIIKQRAVVTSWTQDNTSVTYPIDPRMTETNVYDFNSSGQILNRSRTTISYYDPVSLGSGTVVRLPKDVTEFQADGTTPIRRTFTDYELDPSYLNRRLIGLTKIKELYQFNPVLQNETRMSKVEFEYDETSVTSVAPVQYDTTTSSFRGNVSKVKRYEAPAATNSVSSYLYYNSTGSVVKLVDAAGHEVEFSYADQFFADGLNADATRPSTLAYPTMLTDADDFTSEQRYNYDFGARTWKRTPKPNVQNDQDGPATLFKFDALGRIEQVKNLTNNAYTKYFYRPNFVESFSTVNNLQDEAHSLTVLDGFGRAIATVTNHSDTAGSFAARLVLLDKLGRVSKTSNPTEASLTISTSALDPYSWSAAGADAATGGFGWQYTAQTYDWKGRPLVTTNPDSTTREAIYSGCGCAGGAVMTLTDEGTKVGAPPNDVAKRRQQRIYADVLGRTIRTENLDWENGSVYSTVVTNYDARDQATLVRQFDGTGPSDISDLSCPSGTCQKTVMEYDGYGRLSYKHLPEQGSGVGTTYSYNADDDVLWVEDARQTKTHYTYSNNRHLVTGVSYTVPSGSTINVPNSVTYQYDAVGNRISMTERDAQNSIVGSTAYVYDELSRLDSETRQFSDLPSSSFTIGYDYNLAGQLTSITDPFNAPINYTHDKAGRLNSVTGPSFGGTSTYASNIQYRAWGGVKHMQYQNGNSLDATYSKRLQPTTWDITNVFSKTYDYYADGSLRFSGDAVDHKWDRFYSYDHLGQIKEAFSGAEARFETTTDDRPYRQTFNFDPMGHLTTRTTKNWDQSYPSSDSYANNRREGWNYDNNGNLLFSGDTGYEYDAGGRILKVNSFNPQTATTRSLDGDGLQVKTVNSVYNETTETWGTPITRYYIRSSVLSGQVLTEVEANGNKKRTFVYANGEVLAWQYVVGIWQNVAWEHRDPSNASYRMANSSGTTGFVPEGEPAELDPVGIDAGLTAPPPPPPPLEGNDSWLNYPAFGDPGTPGRTYSVDGIPVPAATFMVFFQSTYQSAFGLMDSVNKPIGRRTITEWGHVVRHGAVPPDDLDNDIIQFGTGDSYPVTILTSFPIYGTLSSEGLNLFDFSGGAAPQNSQPLPSDLKDRIAKIVNNPKVNCAGFIKKLLGNLKGKAYSDDPMKLFERVQNEKGFRLGNTGKYSGLASIDGGKRLIKIRPISSTTNERLSEHQAYAYAVTALNELMHQARDSGTYLDRELAVAIFPLLTPEEREANPLPKTSDVDTNSSYFHPFFTTRCPSLSGE